LLVESVLINCPLCKYRGEVIELLDLVGKPIDSFVY
jgi:hypothetical protein